MPPEFEHLSLDEILYQYADKLSENTGIQVTYTSGSCNPIPNETAHELYRIVQENHHEYCQTRQCTLYFRQPLC